MRGTLDKDKIKKLYLNGYNANEIAKIIKSNVETVRTCIKRNFKHIKSQHEIARVAKRETVKAINYEAKNCMTDKTFIKTNRSIYKTNPNGDIIINKDININTTWDTPKRLNNERDLTI